MRTFRPWRKVSATTFARISYPRKLNAAIVKANKWEVIDSITKLIHFLEDLWKYKEDTIKDIANESEIYGEIYK